MSFFWCTMSNAQLDNMRLCKAGDDFIVEDTDNREFILRIDRK